MRNIEKSLTSYVKGNGPRISREVLLSVAHKDANDIINILFNVINKELNTIKGNISLDRVSFKRLLGPISELLKRNMEKYQTFVSNKK